MPAPPVFPSPVPYPPALLPAPGPGHGPVASSSLQGLFTGAQGSAPMVPLHEGVRFVEPGGAELWMPGATAPALIPRSDQPTAAPQPPQPGPVVPWQLPRESRRRGLRRATRRAASTLPIPVVTSPTHHPDPAPPDPRPDPATAADPGGAEAIGAEAIEDGPIEELEGAAFAARFVAEFLSWDEDNPALRAQVLRTLLRDPRGATLGWSGAGRQRVELVLPGRTLRTGGGLIVEVTARVLSFHRTCPRPDTPPPITDAGVDGRSCCPPPSETGWAPGTSSWARLAPPVVRLGTGELKVDLGLRPGPAPHTAAHPGHAARPARHGSRGPQR